MKKYLITLLTLLWMTIIFSFSARTAPESAKMSMTVGYKIGIMLVPDFENWTETRQEAFAARIDYPIRKCAHASEYAVLGILLMITAACYGLTGYSRLITVFLIGAVYASSDEFHQLFVPGRSGQISDVMIDCLGLVAGMFLISIVQMIYNRKKRKCYSQLSETAKAKSEKAGKTSKTP